MDDLFEALNQFWHDSGSYLETFDRNRPYNGQPQTDLGERGKQEVRGITMRDVRDACIRAFYKSSCLSSEDYPPTVFDLDFSEMDPVAITQNLCREIEKMMGIYPNVPKLIDIEEQP